MTMHFPNESPEYRAARDRLLEKEIELRRQMGGRSALSGKLLKDFGYGEVYNLGAFKDWAEGGGEVEK